MWKDKKRERWYLGNTSRAGARGREWAYHKLESGKMCPAELWPRPWEGADTVDRVPPHKVWEGTPESWNTDLQGEGKYCLSVAAISVGNDENGSGSVEQRFCQPQLKQMLLLGNAEVLTSFCLPISLWSLLLAEAIWQDTDIVCNFHPSTTEQIIER